MSYSEKDIVALSERDHVRKRVNVYLGANELTKFTVPSFKGDKLNLIEVEFVPAAVKAVGEIIDNAVDELTLCGLPNRHMHIMWSEKEGRCVVEDTGRGVPIAKHATGVFTPQVVFGSFRTGRNFDDGNRTSGVMGVNGVGSSATNCCSRLFDVTIQRDGKRYHQVFKDGMAIIEEPTIIDLPKKEHKHTGTRVELVLDDQVFKSTNIPTVVFHSKAHEIALNNPDIKVSFTDLDTQETDTWANRSIKELFSSVGFKGYGFTSSELEFWVALDAHTEIDEKMFTWVNSSYLYDGGSCNTQFMNAFSDMVIENLQKDAKRSKCEVTKNDIRYGLVVFSTLKLKQPAYDSQAKTRLVGPNLRKDIDQILQAHATKFNRVSKEWQRHVLERAMRRTNAKAKDAAQQAAKKLSTISIPNLVDAVNDDRSKCCLYILEGLSAAGPLIEVRDPSTMATFPLGGKFNNVWGASVSELMQMGKLTNLLLAIGLIPGKKAIRSQLRYNKVVIATDADTDGGDIFTLLVCLLYSNWPELFADKEDPYLFRLVAPNIAASKGKQRIHFASRAKYEAVADKYTGWQIDYYKGLGSLVYEDWEMMIHNKDCYLPIYDDGKLHDVLKLLFSDDTLARRTWLSGS